MRKFEEFLHSLASTVGVVSKQAMEEILRLVRCQQVDTCQQAPSLRNGQVPASGRYLGTVQKVGVAASYLCVTVQPTVICFFEI